MLRAGTTSLLLVLMNLVIAFTDGGRNVLMRQIFSIRQGGFPRRMQKPRFLTSFGMTTGTGLG
jgi:hypothetical protein